MRVLTCHVNKPVEIANCFNHHFSTIAKKLTDKLPLSASKFTDYLPPPNPSSMFMTPTNQRCTQTGVPESTPAGVSMFCPEPES